MGIRELVVRHLCEIGPSLSNQSFGINKPDFIAGLFNRQSFINHLFDNQVCNACSSLSCTHENKGLILQPRSLHSSSTHETGERNRCSSLDIIIKSADFLTVLGEESKGVGVAKVLELNENPREFFAQRSDYLMHESIILFPSDTRFWNSSIERIFEKLGIVSSNIDGNWEAMLWRDASACSVQIQFSNRNSHAVSSKVSQTKDSLSISHNHYLDVIERPIIQQLANTSLVFNGDVKTSWSLKNIAILLAGFTDRRGIDVGHHLRNMINDDSIKKSLISLL
mmetsp:Transcript_14407/g.49214  ORF Transcript_14407/g.49214 Transcript_14407/m.49214 type:complete len:281 (-) Transcript_14407:307-1149(-)